jgi:transposase
VPSSSFTKYPSEYEEPKQVTQIQSKVLTALSQGKSISKAASEAKVDRSTVHRWLNSDPVFLAEYNANRLELIETVRFGIRELSKQAIAALRDLMGPEAPASVRLRAVELVLTVVNQGSPTTEIGSADPIQTERHIREREFEDQGRMNKKEDQAY